MTLGDKWDTDDLNYCRVLQVHLDALLEDLCFTHGLANVEDALSKLKQERLQENAKPTNC